MKRIISGWIIGAALEVAFVPIEDFESSKNGLEFETTSVNGEFGSGNLPASYVGSWVFYLVVNNTVGINIARVCICMSAPIDFVSILKLQIMKRFLVVVIVESASVESNVPEISINERRSRGCRRGIE